MPVFVYLKFTFFYWSVKFITGGNLLVINEAMNL